MTWTLISQDPERANATTATEVQVRVGTTHRMWEMTAFLVLTGGLLAGGAWYVMVESGTLLCHARMTYYLPLAMLQRVT